MSLGRGASNLEPRTANRELERTHAALRIYLHEMRNGFRVARALEQLGRLRRLPALRFEEADEETFRICRTGRIQTFYSRSRCLLASRWLRLLRRPPSSLTRFVAANLIRGRALLYAARLPRPPETVERASRPFTPTVAGWAFSPAAAEIPHRNDDRRS